MKTVSNVWKWIAVCGVIMLLGGLPIAWAQGGGGGMGNRLTAEQSEAAWKLEAQHVASKLGLNEEQSSKLVDAYVQVRKDNIKAWEERRASMQRGPEAREEMRKALLELANTAQENLKKALSAFLDEKQTETAVQRLSNFDARGDLMVHTLNGMNLGEKQADALELVTNYVAESRALMRSRAEAGPTPEDFREKAMALRSKLDQDLAKILTEEQMTSWKNAVGFGAGQGPREGARPRGPQAGGPGQGNAENR